jgi:teichuronic acid biosynthesis glycosyltransferase TuaC
MHSLLLPSWYNTPDKPWRGTFIDDQARALARAGVRTGIAFVERRSLSRMSATAWRSSHFQTVLERDAAGIAIARMCGWSTFAQTVTGSRVWSRLMRRVAVTYARVHGTPDLLHGHAALWGGHAAMVAAEALGRPYVVTEHASAIMNGSLSPAERRHAAAIYRNAAAVIAVSEPVRRAVDAIAGRAVSEILPSTVDTSYFEPPRFPRDGPFTFLAVADLIASKRLDLLIAAFVRLRIRHPEVRLVIAGSGKERGRLEATASLLDGTRSIRFTGALSRAEVRRAMQEADALVLPSDYETFGVVLIEAMASGVPLLATRCGGPEEIVTPATGLLVDCDDSDALLRAMGEMMRRPFDAAQLHAAAQARFGYEAFGGRLRALYGRLLGERAAADAMQFAAGERRQAPAIGCRAEAEASAQLIDGTVERDAVETAVVDDTGGAHRAGIRVLQSGGNAQERRLSGAIRADQSGNASADENAVKASKNFLGAVALMNAREGERTRSAHEGLPVKSMLVKSRIEKISAPIGATAFP